MNQVADLDDGQICWQQKGFGIGTEIDEGPAQLFRVASDVTEQRDPAARGWLLR
jgi:hypothetical protein